MVRCFQINPIDNTAVLLDDAAAGETVEIIGGEQKEIVMATAVAYGHKVALSDIEPGQEMIKYGICIGRSTQKIRAGEWVHLHNCASDYDKRSSTLDVHTGATTDTVYE